MTSDSRGLKSDSTNNKERCEMTGTTPGRTLTMCVVICVYTFDRWDDVLAAVASVRSQKTAPEEIVVVVDHNPDLYSRLRPVLPDVTVVENRYQRGLSGGKNTGVEVTSSDVVAFLDDDAVAHPDWLDTFATPTATRASWASAAPPSRSGSPPGLGGSPKSSTGSWAARSPGGNPGRSETSWAATPPFVARFSRFQVGSRPTSGGRRRRRHPLGCEETEFCIRVSQHRPDWTFVFEPRAVIWHRVPAARERLDYFRSRCFAEGLSKAAVTRSVGIADGLSAERRYTARPHARCGAGARRGTARRSCRYRAFLRHLCRAARRCSGLRARRRIPPAATGDKGGAMTESVPILMYHAVSEHPRAATRRLSVTPRSLEEQLAFLVDHGFTGLTFADLGDAFRAGRALPKRPVVLTFDDGYADFDARHRRFFDATSFQRRSSSRPAG